MKKYTSLHARNAHKKQYTKQSCVQVQRVQTPALLFLRGQQWRSQPLLSSDKLGTNKTGQTYRQDKGGPILFRKFFKLGTNKIGIRDDRKRERCSAYRRRKRTQTLEIGGFNTHLLRIPDVSEKPTFHGSISSSSTFSAMLGSRFGRLSPGSSRF